MLGQNLKQLYESLGPVECVGKLSSLLAKKEIKPEDFSLKEMAEAFCGRNWVNRLWEGNQRRGLTLPVLEAGEAVDVSAFSNITGQLVFSKIHQGWEQVEKICDKIFTVVPTQLDGEKVPGIGMIKGVGQRVLPGQPYPETSFGEQYWNTPSTDKHGEIVSVEKETIFFDRTGLVLKRASQLGERLSYNKEIRCLACLAGITVTVGNESFVGNNHSWSGDTFNTYSTTDQSGGVNTTNKIYANAVASIDLVDWTNLESLWLKFQDQLDPDTGLPINVGQDLDLIVMPFKNFTAMRIVRATEVRSGNVPTSGNGQQTLASNPFDSGVVGSVLMSRLLYQQIVSSGVSAANAKYWFFYGNFKKAFEYRENWPLLVLQAPDNSTANFERDIVLRYKGSERGVPWVADPRYVTKGYNSA